MTTRDEYLDCGCVPPGSLNEPGRHICGRYNLPAQRSGEADEAPEPCRHCRGTGSVDGQVCGDCCGLAVDCADWYDAIVYERSRNERLSARIETHDEMRLAAYSAVERDKARAKAGAAEAIVTAAQKWLARVEPYPERNGDHFRELREILAGRLP